MYFLKTSYSFRKLRYRILAKKCRPLLHCMESLERDDIETLGLQIKDERHILTS